MAKKSSQPADEKLVAMATSIARLKRRRKVLTDQLRDVTKKLRDERRQLKALSRFFVGKPQ